MFLTIESVTLDRALEAQPTDSFHAENSACFGREAHCHPEGGKDGLGISFGLLPRSHARLVMALDTHNTGDCHDNRHTSFPVSAKHPAANRWP